MLKAGDAIFATTSDGSLTTGTLSFLSHADASARATFVVLSTADGRKLTLTPQHHVPTGAVCCSNLKLAKDVVVGDTVYVAGTGVAAATPSAVTSMSKTVAMGLHSPVLKNGAFPIVNGVVTAFDAITKVTLASYGLTALEAMCQMTGTCTLIAATVKNYAA